MDAQPEKEHIRHTGTNFEETVQSTRDKANWKCYVTSVINLSPSPGGGVWRNRKQASRQPNRSVGSLCHAVTHFTLIAYTSLRHSYHVMPSTSFFPLRYTYRLFYRRFYAIVLIGRITGFIRSSPVRKSVCPLPYRLMSRKQKSVTGASDVPIFSFLVQNFKD